MESEDPYESLPNTKLSITMFAGASAGIMEHIVMYPVDTIKVSYSSERLRFNITKAGKKIE
jgi:hypothetical protein